MPVWYTVAYLVPSKLQGCVFVHCFAPYAFQCWMPIDAHGGVSKCRTCMFYDTHWVLQRCYVSVLCCLYFVCWMQSNNVSLCLAVIDRIGIGRFLRNNNITGNTDAGCILRLILVLIWWFVLTYLYWYRYWSLLVANPFCFAVHHRSLEQDGQRESGAAIWFMVSTCLNHSFYLCCLASSLQMQSSVEVPVRLNSACFACMNYQHTNIPYLS
jgi:hypothetical protein